MSRHYTDERKSYSFKYYLTNLRLYRLKLLHLPFTYYPDPIGGTEAYVQSLVRVLSQYGHHSVIAAPGQQDASYVYESVPVYRYAPSEVDDPSGVYNQGDPLSAAKMAHILDVEQPDIMHVHSLSRAVSLMTVREAQKRQIPVVFTHHVPTVSCVRGTLIYLGNFPCDGRLDVTRCAFCNLNKLGVGLIGAHMLSRVPEPIGDLLQRAGKQGGIWTALRMRQLVALRQQVTHDFWEAVDHIVALNAWTRDLLLLNHVPSSKITVLRHTRAASEVELKPVPSPNSDDTLKLVFLGRLAPEKGLDVVVQALSEIPQARISLDIYGIYQSDTPYTIKLLSLIEKDNRIRLCDPVPQDDVLKTLTQYHVLVVPSRWLETGPLVILDAFAAGIPVIGTGIGGIAEWVEHGKNGLLVDVESVKGWKETLLKVRENLSLLDKLRESISPPPDHTYLAKSMLKVYNKVIF